MIAPFGIARSAVTSHHPPIIAARPLLGLATARDNHKKVPMRPNTRRWLAAFGFAAMWITTTAIRTWCFHRGTPVWWLLILVAGGCAFTAGYLIAFTRKDHRWP